MELLVIFVVALLVLGPTKLPEAGRQVGRALAEFRRWSAGVQNELREVLDVEPGNGGTTRPPVIEPPAGGNPGPVRSVSELPEEQSFT